MGLADLGIAYNAHQKALHKRLLRVPWTSRLLPYSAAAAAAKSLQSCPTLCDPIDGSPPGSPIPGILQARTLDIIQP